MALVLYVGDTKILSPTHNILLWFFLMNQLLRLEMGGFRCCPWRMVFLLCYGFRIPKDNLFNFYHVFSKVCGLIVFQFFIFGFMHSVFIYVLILNFYAFVNPISIAEKQRIGSFFG